MLRQSSSRNQRSRKFRPSHSLQAFLLVAVGIWIVYQLTRTYGKQRVVAVETDRNDGEPARRRLGRKGFVDFPAGQASVDDIARVRDESDAGRGDDSSDNPLSKAGDGEGDEEDQEADEDDGVDSDADDGLAADEEDDDRDLRSQNGSSEDELKTTHGETQNGLNTSFAPPVNATDTVQGGAAVLLANATGGYALKNNTSSAHLSLHGRGTSGDVVNKLLANSFSVGSPGTENEKSTNNGSAGENQNLQISKNGTADSVAGHGISS